MTGPGDIRVIQEHKDQNSVIRREALRDGTMAAGSPGLVEFVRCRETHATRRAWEENASLQPLGELDDIRVSIRRVNLFARDDCDVLGAIEDAGEAVERGSIRRHGIGHSARLKGRHTRRPARPCNVKDSFSDGCQDAFE